MVAAGTATAELLSLPVSSDNETMRRIAHLLSRSLAAEGISDDLIDTLEDILGDRPDLTPAVGGSKLDGRLIRLGLPSPGDSSFRRPHRRSARRRQHGSQTGSAGPRLSSYRSFRTASRRTCGTPRSN